MSLIGIGGYSLSKEALRSQILQQLHQLNPSEHERLSRAVLHRVLASDEFKQAQTIGITMSKFPEVETRPLIEAAWRAGKQVAIPKCIRSTRQMDFRVIEDFGQTETVYMNLEEPIVQQTPFIRPEEIDLQIVPGVVFSLTGYRIGFGGGYYDRYLADYIGRTVSLAFELQVGHMIDVEPHDVPVEKLFTDQRIIDCQEEVDDFGKFL